ncbi:MAG: MFS transporter [Hasllibacter sp.]
MSDAAAAPRTGPGRAEFVAMMAMLAATVAFSIDAMLPAIGAIADELTPEAPNLAQLVISAFFLGLGLGTLIAGPISDAIGRRAAVGVGAALYCTGAAWAALAGSLEALLAARVLQGIGASGPRVTMIAIVRDRFEGAAMARILSFVMTVFTLVPAIAPLIGAGIIALAGWRAVFAAFVAFSALSVGWLLLRMPETLAPSARRPLRPAALRAALAEATAHPLVRRAVAVQAMAYGMLLATLSAAPDVSDAPYGRAGSFALWFALLAAISSGGALLNARLVRHLALARIVAGTLTVNAALSALALAAAFAGALPFLAFWGWAVTIFAMAGLVMGNVNTIALAPLAHMAGFGASLVSSLATVAAVALAVPVGLLYDGSPVPLLAGAGIMAALGAWLARRL